MSAAIWAEPRRSRWDVLGVLLLAVLLWLLSHPYQGIWHDARIYGLLAAQWLYPDALAGDLFFRYGSQGSLSLFTPFYGWLVGWLGLDIAARLVVLTGGILWVVALWSLSRKILGDGPLALFALFLGVSASFNYSPNGAVFVLNENFASARSLAMPLGLIAATALISGRLKVAVLLSLASCALHPLVGVWPLALVVVTGMPRSVTAATALLAPVALCVVGATNLDIPGLRVMSGEWLASIRDPALDVVVGADLGNYIGWLGCLLLGHRIGDPRFRAHYGLAALIAATALLVARIAAVWFPVEIVIQSQLWRAFWLAIPLAGLAVLDVVRQGGLRGLPLGPVWAGAAGCIVLYPGLFPLISFGAWLLAGLVGLPGGALVMTWYERNRVPVLAVAGLIWVVAIPGLWADVTRAGYRFVLPWWHGFDWLHGLVAGGLWPLPFALAWAAGWGATRWMVVAPAILLLPMVVYHWDHRPPGRLDLERCYLNKDCAPHPLRTMVRPGESVFWPDHELTVWFRVGTQNYVSLTQGVGRVFSEARFFEWKRRQALAYETGETGQADRPRRVTDLCRESGPDWVVSAEAGSGEGRPSMSFRESQGTWHLYDCRGVAMSAQSGNR